MKILKLKHIWGMVAIMAITMFASCSDDDGSSKSTSAPVIESVAPAEDEDLVPVEVGFANNMYVIRGRGFSTLQKVYFNETDTYFNPTMVTETTIFVTIDEDTPYADSTNELKIVTQYGTAVVPFVVAPPAPQLQSFQPVNANAGEQITLYGKFFLDPTVTIGGVEAEIVSNTLTEIVAIVPPDSHNKRVTVTTISGESEWNTAIGTAIYDDAFYSPWTIEEWNEHEYITNRAQAYQGTTFIKKEMDGWGNIQGNWGWDENISQYTGIRFSVRSDDPGKLELIFNGDWTDNVARQFNTTTEWKEHRFTWAQLGGMPQALQNITFKEFTGATHNYYFDNIGYTID
ncbi:IPT/TIG domain-containing protein [Flavobacterium sp. MK4S-17]|uniref:IPT/TIG domain-containing protein n=1 Tax=Flavobacterium sp. MK4S-17 TaxID=2543737 RepID=UPI00135A5FFE|nr:IPT/TIG domain-containing protein [Flavobacterium sp. MK4S-17]